MGVSLLARSMLNSFRFKLLCFSRKSGFKPTDDLQKEAPLVSQLGVHPEAAYAAC